MSATRTLAAAVLLAAAGGPATPAHLPRFTDEREAAALAFVRKHCPELVPLLDGLKRSNRPAYEQQVRETFQVTEYLADLQDDPKRHELELKVWKAENKSLVQVARLATAGDADRAAAEGQLRTLARELVELDVKSAEYRVTVLERELSAAKEAVVKGREDIDKAARERYDGLLEKARKRRPPGP